MAPIVAGLLKLGLSGLANAFLAKGSDWIKEKTGVDVEAALGTEEGRLRLRQAELEHELALQALQLEDNKLGLEFARLEVADRSSARTREVDLANSDVPIIGKITTPILAIITVLGFFSVLCYLLYNAWSGFVLTDGVKEVLYLMLGALSAQTANVYSYYFGSSAGSMQKTLGAQK